MSTPMTVDWGIDLGTTNSSIAAQRGDRVVVVPNTGGEDTTPSAVCVRTVDGQRFIDVGKRAKNRVVQDPGGVALEFKQNMGNPEWTFTFPGSPGPEAAWELSSYVLKDLTASVAMKAGLSAVHAAVIGVPAAFVNPQYDDTVKAAERAGIDYVQLIPEPVAAALAFALESRPQGRSTWLAYDLGGGTFDAALVRGEDGVFSVLDHEGDRELGGKHLDNAIVMKLIYPRLPERVRSSVVEWKSLSWRLLKEAAEVAKCALSARDEYLFDASIGDHQATLPLTQEDVNRLQVAVFARTLDLCRALIQRNGFSARDIEKVVLVGGPTLSPFLRGMIEHGVDAGLTGRAVEGLRIPLDCSVDPMTAVARGAAVFAAGLLIPGAARRADPSATRAPVTVSLQYSPQAAEADALVTGGLKATGDGTAPTAEWRVRLERVDVAGRPTWQAQAAVSERGAFGQRVPLLEGANEFRIVVLDAEGRVVDTDAGAFKIVKGIKAGPLSLPRSIGVADRHGLTRWIFRRECPLPDVKSDFFFTTTAIERGKSDTAVVIPVVEGEEAKAHLNRRVYSLTVTGDRVATTIPKGTEVEVEISINESRQIAVTARFVDYAVEAKSDLLQWDSDLKDLRAALDAARRDLALFQRVQGESDELRAVVHDVEERGTVEEAERLLALATDGSPEPARQAEDRVLELLRLIDRYQELANALLAWEPHQRHCDKNVAMAEKIVGETRGLDRQWIADFEGLRARYHEAVRRRDFEGTERLAYTDLPELFKRNDQLKARVGGGPSTKDATAQVGSSTQLLGSIE